MTPKQALVTRVRDIIADLTCAEEEAVTSDANLVQDLGADSLDTIEIIMALEAEFSIEIDDEVAERLTTPGKIVAYLDSVLE